MALKNAVYVLPRRDECLADFQRVAEEAIAEGGEAYVCEAEFLESRTDTALVEQFRGVRDAEYEALARTIRERIGSGRLGPSAPPEEDLPAFMAHVRKRFDEIARIDFFQASRRSKTGKLLREIESRRPAPRPAPSPGDLAGRTWVTRRGLHIDRIASAWLIRRFVDPKARFRFIDPKEPAREHELRFDMVDGDFSHEGDRCTFETLLARTGVANRSLTEIAEIVHDIDLKDGKFGRPEAPGLEQLLVGLVLANPEDEARLERGFVLFDELFQSFRKKSPTLSKEVLK